MDNDIFALIGLGVLNWLIFAWDIEYDRDFMTWI